MCTGKLNLNMKNDAKNMFTDIGIGAKRAQLFE